MRFTCLLAVVTATLIAACFTSSALADDYIKGKVAASKLNVRVLPDTRFTVVSTLKRGDIVKVVKQQGEWYEIVAPENSEVYVARSFVKNNEILKPVNLRSGPSVAYKPYGVAQPGTKIKILNDARTSWIQIAPPPGLTGWVSKAYIQVSVEDAEKLDPQPKPVVAKTDKKDPKEATPANPPQLATQDKKPEDQVPEGDAPPELTPKQDDKKPDATAGSDELPFVKGEEKAVTLEGILLPLAPDSVYVTHALATKIRNEYFPICYIHSKDLDLKLWIKRKIRVKGTQRTVKGWKRPVVEVERITPMWD